MSAPHEGREAVERHDGREIYCRRLGHPIHFGYCRTTDGGTLCPKIADCWFARFDVVSFLREHHPPAEVEGLAAAPPPKVVTLLELVERARSARATARP